MPGRRPARRELAFHVVLQQHPGHRGGRGSQSPSQEGSQLPGLHAEVSALLLLFLLVKFSSVHVFFCLFRSDAVQARKKVKDIHVQVLVLMAKKK